MPVDVEVDVGAGLPSFSIVGLPDLAVQEARERVRAALRAEGFEIPNARIVVNLAPGPLRKHGTGFDLPIALGLLIATRQLPRRPFEDTLSVGELSLDGSVRRVPGLLAHAMAARRESLSLLGPRTDGLPAGLAGIEYLALDRLSSLRQGLPTCGDMRGIGPTHPEPDSDFSEVVGQALAIRALVIAAAGGHNVLMVGPPGSGKTMLARRLPTILPELGDSERLETAIVHSVAGLDPGNAIRGHRPFRAPHHTASIAGLVGGGTPPKPGEATLAHNGVLFLDEMPEFGPAALQCLRQPLEDGAVTVVRAEGRVLFPARFALVGAANPCPCGYLGDRARSCACPPSAIDRYRSRVGGPLMDRIDLVVDVERPDPRLMLVGSSETSSSELRSRVSSARDHALGRGPRATTQLSGAELLGACRLSPRSVRALEQAARRHQLSGRGVTRLLRVARTIADLEECDRVGAEHLAEALGFRADDRS